MLRVPFAASLFFSGCINLHIFLFASPYRPKGRHPKMCFERFVLYLSVYCIISFTFTLSVVTIFGKIRQAQTYIFCDEVDKELQNAQFFLMSNNLSGT